MKINKQTNFDSTLNLPKETIPLDAKLTKKQGYFLESLQDPKKYSDAQNKNKAAEKLYNISEFPKRIEEKLSPKDIVNEIYKDVLTRYECMQGNLINHKIGFLYETNIEDENGIVIGDEKKNRITFQKKLYDETQEKIHDVRTLGTVIDYSRSNYSMISNDFCNKVISKFYEMYKSGDIVLEKSPMYYCSKCDKHYGKNEVKYVKKKHGNLYAKYRVKDDNTVISKYSNLRNTYVIAITTSPWQVGACDTLVIEKDSMYSLVEVEEKGEKLHYIIKKDYVAHVMEEAFFTKYEIKDEISSEDLEKFILINPMDYMKEVKVLSCDTILVSPDAKYSSGARVYVPDYSYIDFLISNRLGNKARENFVDKNGVILKGNNRIIGKTFDEANKIVMDYLRKGDFIFLNQNIPFIVTECKNCGEENIYYEGYSFYIKTNKDMVHSVKNIAIELVKKANFSKENDRKKLMEKIEKLRVQTRVKISDYSNIGIIIPMYACKDCGNVILNDEVVELTESYINNSGIAQINSNSADEILKGKVICKNCNKNNIVPLGLVFNSFFKKMCVDVVDTKIENTDNKTIIDVLVESRKDFIEILKYAMYNKEIKEQLENVEMYIIHSDVREDTKIIAKPIFFDKTNKEDIENSLVSEIGIKDVSKKYGTDILRLWGVLSARENNIILNEQKIVKANYRYKLLRKTIKYLLSNLQDFNPEKDYIEVEKRNDIDKYIYKKLYEIFENVKEEYEKCNFDNACKKILEFCKKDLCRDYFSSLKYTLYLLDKNDENRLKTLSNFFDIFMQLVTYLEPIIPFTLEEAWKYAWHSSKEEEKNILMHRENISLNKLEDESYFEKWDKIFKFVRNTNKLIRKEIFIKKYKNSLEMKLILNVLSDKVEFLNENKETLKRTLNVSNIEINEVKNEKEKSVKIEKADGEMCVRCKNYTMDIGRDIRYLHLCLDCVKILEKEK